MIAVHHLENSRSHRVLWLLEELGLPYTLHYYQRDPNTMLAPDALRAIHPLGKSPTLEDEGLVLAESGAIIEYILDRYGEGRLQPEANPERAYYRFWMHYAEGSVMPLFVMKLVVHQMSVQGPRLAKPLLKMVGNGLSKGYIHPQMTTHIRFWEQILTYNPYFAGKDFSAADIQMSFALEALAQGGGPPGINAENSLRLLETLRKRPAYQSALKKGGGLTLASRS